MSKFLIYLPELDAAEVVSCPDCDVPSNLLSQEPTLNIIWFRCPSCARVHTRNVTIPTFRDN